MSSFMDVRFKVYIITDDTDCYKIDGSSEMTIDFFGDFTCALEFAVLKENRVKDSLAKLEIKRELMTMALPRYKQFGYSGTSFKKYLGNIGEVSRIILQDDECLWTQPTYYGFGRQRVDSLEGSMTQVIWSFSSLYKIYSTYKLYNTYS